MPEPFTFADWLGAARAGVLPPGAFPRVVLFAPEAFGELLEQAIGQDSGWAGESCAWPAPAPDWPDGHGLRLPAERSAALADAQVSALPCSGCEIFPGGSGLARALAALHGGAAVRYMARGWMARIWREGPGGRYGAVVLVAGSAVDVMYAESLSELIDTVCGTYGWD